MTLSSPWSSAKSCIFTINGYIVSTNVAPIWLDSQMPRSGQSPDLVFCLVARITQLCLKYSVSPEAFPSLLTQGAINVLLTSHRNSQKQKWVKKSKVGEAVFTGSHLLPADCPQLSPLPWLPSNSLKTSYPSLPSK